MPKLFKPGALTKTMFGKKKCPRCTKKCSKDYDFCPYCGAILKNLQQEAKEYGMLGKDDDLNEFLNPEPRLGGFSSSFFNKMFSSAMKMLEKEMKELDRKNTASEETAANPNFQLYINGKRIELGNPSQINAQEKHDENIKVQKVSKLPMPSEEIIKSSSKLPRQEAKTKLTRLANKVIYEIESNEAISPERLLINKLEDGYEIKIFGRKSVVYKNLQIKLPLLLYSIQANKIFLEFKAK